MPWGVATAALGAYSAYQGTQVPGDAADTEAQAQMQALEYQQEVEQLPLEIRNQFLPMLADYYGGGEGQQAFIDETKASPFYDQMIRTGQEGVLASAGQRGLTRSGNTASDLNQSNQMVLQNLVNQRLSGVSSLAQTPLNTNAIAGGMAGIGATQAAGQVATGQAKQDMYGNIIDLAQTAYGQWG